MCERERGRGGRKGERGDWEKDRLRKDEEGKKERKKERENEKEVKEKERYRKRSRGRKNSGKLATPFDSEDYGNLRTFVFLGACPIF